MFFVCLFVSACIALEHRVGRWPLITATCHLPLTDGVSVSKRRMRGLSLSKTRSVLRAICECKCQSV